MKSSRSCSCLQEENLTDLEDGGKIVCYISAKCMTEADVNTRCLGGVVSSIVVVIEVKCVCATPGFRIMTHRNEAAGLVQPRRELLYSKIYVSMETEQSTALHRLQIRMEFLKRITGRVC